MKAKIIAAALLFIAPQMLSWSQSTPPPQITIFLADPQLGVVGADQSGGNTLFFEARKPTGSTQLSVRLLDASGRTIAISGHSMDSRWLTNADFNPADATQSLSLAAGLPNALATVLNRTVFPNEYAAISDLATSAAGVAPGVAPAVFDSATANLATVTQSVVDAGANFDAAAATALNSTRDSSGNLRVTFGNTAMQTFVESSPNAQNEDGTRGGFTEGSARLVATDGTSWDNLSSRATPPTSTDGTSWDNLSSRATPPTSTDGTNWDNLSSRSAPPTSTDGTNWDNLSSRSTPPTSTDGTSWDNLSSRSTPPTSTDALQPFIEAGNAVRGGALMTRFSSIATANEITAVGQLTAALRDNALLPQAPSLAHASDSRPTASTICGIFGPIYQHQTIAAGCVRIRNSWRK